MLPKGWKKKTLEEVAEFTNGKAHEKSIVEAGPYVVVNSKFVSTGGEVRKYSDENLCPLAPKDIAMVMSDIPNGRALASCFYVDEPDLYTLNQRICGLRATKVDSKYLFYSLFRNSYFLAFDSGVGQTNLRKDEVLQCPILCPPLPEQRKIAEILSCWDSAIETIEKLIDAKTRFKKGLIRWLTSGNYLSDLEGQTKELPSKYYSALRKTFYPKDWTVVHLEDLVELVYGKSPKDIISDKGICPVIGTSGVVNRTNSPLHTEPAVIIGRKGTIDHPLLVTEPFWAIDTVYFTKSKRKLNIKWLYYYLCQIPFKRYNEASGVPSLSRSTLYRIPILVPPIEVQNRIGSILATVNEELGVLLSFKTLLVQQKSSLMQKLLTGKTRVSTSESTTQSAQEEYALNA